MKMPKREEYNELFRYENQLSVLHSEFFVTGSMRKGEVLVVSDDKLWSSYIHKKREKDCLKAGLELFRSKEKYAEYAGSFREYIKNTVRPIISEFKKVPRELDPDRIKNFFSDLAKFWHFYGLTEYSYYDLAHKIMLRDKDEILKKNLSDLGKLKFEGRAILNAYTFKGGVVHNFLDLVSKTHLKEDDAQFLLAGEIRDLIGGKKIDRKKLLGRKKYYAFTIRAGALHEFSLSQARKIHAIFTALEKADEVSGVTANKGRAVGRAVIAPMLSDMERVREISAKMKKGDILIAQTTSPEYLPLCKLAGAIVTDQGGMLSHAAIVSRELGIPCLVGTNVATRVFKNGDLIEVDAKKGKAKRVK